MADTKASESKDVVPWHKKIQKGSEYTVLKPKFTVAVMRRYLFNTSVKEIAETSGMSKSHLFDILKSPAAKEIKRHVEEKTGDLVELTKDMAKANALGVTLDWYEALEWAKEGRDFKAVASMAKDLAALGGVQATPPKQEIEHSKTIKIVFEGDSLDQEPVEAEWEEIDDDDEDF